MDVMRGHVGRIITQSSGPAVTVVIPTFNRPHLLKRAIGSVLRQTYAEFKVCVYDNASSDDTRRIVDEIMGQDRRVAYHRHKRNIGAVGNFHHGLMRVDTPFFSLLSDDDFLLPNFLDTTMAGFRNHPETLFSAGSVVTMTDQGKILYEPFSLWKREGMFLPPQGLLETLGGKYPVWTGILFRREVIELTGGLDVEMAGTADLDFVHRISVKAPFVISKRPVAVCVNHTTSASAAPSLSAYWPSWRNMIRKITDDREVPQSVKDAFERSLTEQTVATLFWIGTRSLERGNFDQAEEAATILKYELNQGRKGGSLAWLARQGRKFPLFWRIAAASIVLRRNVMSLINFKRRKLQKRHGHLAARLKYE